MLDLFMRAVCDYYDRPNEQPTLSIRFDKKTQLFKARLFLDVDEGDDSLVAEAEGKKAEEAINRLAEAWAKMKFGTGTIETFLGKLR